MSQTWTVRIHYEERLSKLELFSLDFEYLRKNKVLKHNSINYFYLTFNILKKGQVSNWPDMIGFSRV